MTSQPTICIVEDERDIADLFAAWLESDYECRVAYGGDEALKIIDQDVDAILLDRRMPDRSGDEVLAELRTRDINCPVGMVTAVEPDLDIVEMGFDDYIVKPVGGQALQDFVKDLLSVSSYERDIRRLYQLANKRAVLETTKQDPELKESEAYQELLQELEHARETADAHRDSLSDDQLFSELK